MPCRTIVVANRKGGTGKTSMTLSLGMGFARLGKRVLLVDVDPQGDLTKPLGWKDPDALEETLANRPNAVIEGEALEPAEGILSYKEGNDLMLANIELAEMEMPVLMAMSRELPLKDDVLAACETDKHYQRFLSVCKERYGRYLKVIELFMSPSAGLERARKEVAEAIAMPFGGRLS